MKQVTKFITEDGDLFDTEEEALNHENYYLDVEKVYQSVLPEEVETVEFLNGHGYIQLSSNKMKELTNSYLSIIKKYHDEKMYKRAKECPTGIIGRYLCDGGAIAYKLYDLLDRIDQSNRLWGQAFYAINPNRGDQTCLFAIE